MLAQWPTSGCALMIACLLVLCGSSVYVQKKLSCSGSPALFFSCFLCSLTDPPLSVSRFVSCDLLVVVVAVTEVGMMTAFSRIQRMDKPVHAESGSRNRIGIVMCWGKLRVKRLEAERAPSHAKTLHNPGRYVGRLSTMAGGSNSNSIKS